jgi:hypothetical protein
VAAARELDQKQKKERGEEKEIVFPFFKGGQTNEFKH